MGLRIFGVIAEHADGLRAELAAKGYTANASEALVAVLRDLSRWADRESEPRDEDWVGRYAAHRRSAGRRRYLRPQTLAPVLDHLRTVGAVPRARTLEPSGVDAEMADYRRWMVEARGLAPRTIERYEATARRFLAARGGMEAITAAEVRAFLLADCAHLRVGSAKGRAGELRSLLRFAFVSGRTPADLATTVPGAAGWRGTSLPPTLAPSVVEALLHSCDASHPTGRRDLAVLKLVARLGLRAAEVAGLCLDDLDWRAGEIVIGRGKSRRADRLPVPVDVGEALVACLADPRPPGEARVFLRRRAPVVGIHSTTVTTIVRFACGRVGIEPIGAHRLRHALAAETLRRGAPLAEVSQLLRHRDLATTAVYAKVDRTALAGLARPWPVTP